MEGPPSVAGLSCALLDLIQRVLEAPGAVPTGDVRIVSALLEGDNDALHAHLVDRHVALERDALLAAGRVGSAALLEHRALQGVDGSALPGHAALAAVAAGAVPGWPEGVEAPTGGPPRSTELRVRLEPGPTRAGEPSTLAGERGRYTTTVTRTVGETGIVPGEDLKDEIYGVERRIDALELELQRMGFPELVLDRRVERDGTVYTGLIEKEEPRRARLQARLAEERAVLSGLYARAVPRMVEAQTITEEVEGAAWEKVMSSLAIEQDGTLRFAEASAPITRAGEGVVGRQRSPGDASVVPGLEAEARAKAEAAVRAAPWQGLESGMAAITSAVIDVLVGETAAQRGWSDADREAERAALRALYGLAAD